MGAERWNYFNYFTEVEEHFQRVRGTGLFLMSPVDWALVENWKNGGIPLEAVLRGIETAFAKKRSKYQNVNSLAYCAQAVYKEAAQMSGTATPSNPVKAPFEREELDGFLRRNADSVRDRYPDIAAALERLAAEDHYNNLEALEQHLTILEDRMAAQARLVQTDEQLLEARRELDATLKPYRSKMTADQLAMLERQYLERWLLERSGLPRLSLFYLA
ncbi:MAG TPA: hypothetical protein VEQ63_01270 [Bryobacteraceae bacterium]|nr:hypothetical protein [Bryobacteraceae bacterium]